MRKNNRQKGAVAEEMVAKKLINDGYVIIERNYYTRYGELDIIAKDGDNIVFVEVKFRSGNRFGTPLESVTPKKQRCIFAAAQAFLVKNDIFDTPLRFDVAEVNGNYDINIVEGALDLTYTYGMEDYL